MEIKKTDNKSLIMYTSMIFIAAILMIVISFFAQKHLEEMNVSETQAENVTLSNKAAKVSEENMQLVELSKSLKDDNTKLVEENKVLVGEKEVLLKENESYRDLVTVYNKLLNGEFGVARSLLGEIYTEDLTAEQKEIYDFLVKKTK